MAHQKAKQSSRGPAAVWLHRRSDWDLSCGVSIVPNRQRFHNWTPTLVAGNSSCNVHKEATKQGER